MTHTKPNLPRVSGAATKLLSREYAKENPNILLGIASTVITFINTAVLTFNSIFKKPDTDTITLSLSFIVLLTSSFVFQFYMLRTLMHAVRDIERLSSEKYAAEADRDARKNLNSLADLAFRELGTRRSAYDKFVLQLSAKRDGGKSTPEDLTRLAEATRHYLKAVCVITVATLGARSGTAAAPIDANIKLIIEGTRADKSPRYKAIARKTADRERESLDEMKQENGNYFKVNQNYMFWKILDADIAEDIYLGKLSEIIKERHKSFDSAHIEPSDFATQFYEHALAVPIYGDSIKNNDAALCDIKRAGVHCRGSKVIVGFLCVDSLHYEFTKEDDRPILEEIAIQIESVLRIYDHYAKVLSA